jgi:hypothetical protein
MPSGGTQQRLRLTTAAALLALSVAVAGALAACGTDEHAATGQRPAAAGTAASGLSAEDVTEKDFDRNDFSDPTTIDNKWSPLAPGTQYIYEGRSDRGHGRLPHRVVFTVTDLTKVIDGVRTVVLWDRDINAGKLLETELAFHAQDNDGNVWNFGEYPEEHKGGKVSGAPDTWISGLAGAKAGVLMRGQPRVGTSSYRQGWAPAIEFGDRAEVYSVGQRDCVPIGCYRNVLVTDETNPFEPADGHQRKYYAPGVGNIRAAPVGGKEKEVLVLVEVRRLSGEDLASARKEALKLDARAYRVRKSLYQHTPPAERTQPVP